MMRRRDVLLAVAAATLATRTPGSAQGAVVLRVATLPNDAASEIFDGIELGMFAKAGLEIRLDTAQNGPAIAAAVAGGALDVGFSNTISIAAAYKRGVPLAFIAPAGIYSSAAPTTVLMVKRDSPIRSARDLNGKTIAANALKNIAQYAPMAWMDKNGGDSSTVRFVEMPADAIAEATDKGRVDAGSMPEPQVSAARTTCRALGNPYDAIGDGFMIAGWFASTVWADDHPDLVRRFVTAMREAAVWANRNPDKSLPILAKYTKLDLQVVHGIVRARFGETLVPAALQPAIDVAAHYKLIDAAYPAQEIIYKPKR